MKKDYTIHAMLLCFGLALLFNLPACYKAPEPFKYSGYETSDTAYYNGEILYPDMIHDDTLIVVDASKLNWCMKYYDIASDGDINDVLNAYCKKK